MFPKQNLSDIVPQDIPLDILYQDADVVVVNKAERHGRSSRRRK